MQLGARLVANNDNMGGRFVESVKNARWSMRLQEAGNGLEIMVEFQVGQTVWLGNEFASTYIYEGHVGMECHPTSTWY